MCEYIPNWIIALSTLAYAIITVLMLCDNKKQLLLLKQQINKNTDVQLYSQRKRVLDQYVKKEYDDIAQDMMILFGADYYIRMDALRYDELTIDSIKDKKLIERKKSKNEQEFKRLYSDMVEYVKRTIAEENQEK